MGLFVWCRHCTIGKARTRLLTRCFACLCVISIVIMLSNLYENNITAIVPQFLGNWTQETYSRKTKKDPSHLISRDCAPVQYPYLEKVDIQDCSLPYMVMYDNGRLGNKMCQYTCAYLLRHIFGIRVSVTGKMKKNIGHLFKNLSLPVQDSKCFPQKAKTIDYHVLYNNLDAKASNISNWDYKKDSHPQLLGESYRVPGQPCLRRLVSDHRDLVRKSLIFEDDIVQAAKNNIEDAFRKLNKARHNSTLISVHVRRTDYSRFMRSRYHFTVVGKIYLQHAFDYFRKRESNPVFVIVSDDRTWCRQNIQADDAIVSAYVHNPAIDMAILSLGDHHIITYGTFSFMGAILGHGQIVHPVDKGNVYKHYLCCDPDIFIPISRDE